MDIRQLQYLVALAQEQHFTRAAVRCNVTQPTLSGRIRQLEEELGVPLVERGQRYQQLTPEGRHVLRWAQIILEDCASMQQELSEVKGRLSGRLVIGVIPSALPMVVSMTCTMREKHPAVSFAIYSRTSEEILRDVQALHFDVGVLHRIEILGAGRSAQGVLEAVAGGRVAHARRCRRCWCPTPRGLTSAPDRSLH